MTTCPHCTSELQPRATCCPTCGACLERVVPPDLPIPEVDALSESETRERAEHEAAVREVIQDFEAHDEDYDRRAILYGMRHLLADPDGCGSRYHHPAACRALDRIAALTAGR